ncbi:flavin monoamine oxidase family protein [Schumannella luteola]|uniref:Monoamine oxidase n=1 Tax=Schumannella luteola TaxID=472059 RepID=A0A852YFC8_9MICO|nr:monoamine oxidase [Schumannella luteola]TPX01321.1 FAD-dependent oxidoreductase [Schumannella luteola]
MTSRYDAIVIGAGFAGLTAARELSAAGRRVLVLEARDRTGGRTWTERRLGHDLELGGTWVHWTQPFVWAELRRYGIGVVPSPIPLEAWWWNGSETVAGTPDELLDLLDEPNRLLGAESREVFPLPYSPMSSLYADDLDHVHLVERIDQLPLDEQQRTLLRSFWTLNFNGRLDDAALTQALRWLAAANGDWRIMFETCATYKVVGGTRALIEAIAAASPAEILLGRDVVAIDEAGDVAAVTTSGGETFVASDVVVTTPLHALARIRFTPELAPSAERAIEVGQLGLGTKVWFSVEGERPHFVAFGDADWPLNFLQSEYHVDGRTIVIGFGPDSTALDGADVAAVQAAVDRLVPGLRVVETTLHDWVADPHSGETWPMHRVGYLSTGLPALQSGTARIHFAGSDVADGWGGFIDGAIESGMTAARRILDVPAVAAD